MTKKMKTLRKDQVLQIINDKSREVKRTYWSRRPSAPQVLAELFEEVYQL